MHWSAWRFFAFLVWMMSGAVEAASLQVAPLEVTLPTDGRPTDVRLTNVDPTPVLVQVKVFPWVEAEEIDSTPMIKEVIAVPPLAEIPGGSRQLIRLALRQPLQGPRERAYRLVISQVRKELPDQLTGVTFSLRLNLPMYATPEGAEPHFKWGVEQSKVGPQLALANMGTARLNVREISLHDSNGSPIPLASADPETALAGESVSWPLGMSLAELPATMEVRAETNRGSITATVTRPGG